MTVYALFIEIPDTYTYDGTSYDLESIHLTREGAENYGRDRVNSFVRGSGVTFSIEEHEVKE